MYAIPDRVPINNTKNGVINCSAVDQDINGRERADFLLCSLLPDIHSNDTCYVPVSYIEILDTILTEDFDTISNTKVRGILVRLGRAGDLLVVLSLPVSAR